MSNTCEYLNRLIFLLVAAVHSPIAATGESVRADSLHQSLPNCFGCGIDFDQVRYPLRAYARAMGPEAEYEFVISTYSSPYGCMPPVDSTVVTETIHVKGAGLEWKVRRSAEGFTCVTMKNLGTGVAADDEGFTDLSYPESVIFRAYAIHSSVPPRRVQDYCLQRRAPGTYEPTYRFGNARIRLAQAVEFGHPDRRLLLQEVGPLRRMLTPCVGGTNPFIPFAQGLDIDAPIRPLWIQRPVSLGSAGQAGHLTAPVATWVSTRGNVLGTGDMVDVSGLLRGGAQQLVTIFGNQLEIDDPEDVDVEAMVASAVSHRSRYLVGLGPWGELDFPHGRVCIKDMQGPHCNLAVRWDTDQASLPVLRHVASGETLGEGSAGSVSLQLDGAASVQRIELLDSTSRILDRKTAQVVGSAGEISAAQPRCAASPTTAGPDATTCMVELLWSTEYAPSASLWKIGLEPQAAPLLLGRADQRTTLVDQIQANTSIVYELRQMGPFSSGLLASAKVVGEVAN